MNPPAMRRALLRHFLLGLSVLGLTNFWLWLVLPMGAPVCFAQQAQNETSLLRNGDFSNGQTNWNGTFDERLQAEVVTVNDAPAEANVLHALHLTINPKAGEVPWALRVNQTLDKALPIGAPVRFRAWLRSPQRLACAVFLTDHDNTDNKFLSAIPNLTPNWKLVEATGAVSKNFGPGKAFLEFHVGYGAGTIDIAGVQVLLGAAPPPPAPRDYSKLVFPRVLVTKGSLCDTLDTTNIFGAKVNEAAAQTTLRATPPTVRAVLTRAAQLVRSGTPTRVRFAPGLYREELTDLKWDEGQGAQTLLVLEAEQPGTAVFTGADSWPIAGWKRENNGLYSHPWPYAFGLVADPWGPPKTIGHRCEMAFADGVALRQVALERYRDSNGSLWGEAFGGEQPRYEFLGQAEPSTLQNGEFGVFEREGSSKCIYVRLNKTPRKVEVAVRHGALNLGVKSNTVVRGLAFEKFANDVHSNGPLSFAGGATHDVLIDRCRFTWNNMQGLQFGGGATRWTIKNSVFNWNGGSGFSDGTMSNLVLDGNTTNFNNWRVYAGGERGWAFGGVKLHETRGLLVRDHQAIGNLTVGFWCDIHCHDAYFEGGQFGANATNLMWELSQGPFYGKRLLAFDSDGDRTGANIWNNGRTTFDSCLFWKAASPLQGSPGALIDWNSGDRTDEHAQREPINFQGFELRNNVFVAEPSAARVFNLTDARSPFKPNFVPWFFRGENNLFFAPGVAAPVAWQDDERAQKRTDFAGWFAAPRHSETGARLLDPRLRDPKHGDFRLAPDSPLWARRSELPEWTMSPGLKRDLAWFRAWTHTDERP